MDSLITTSNGDLRKAITFLQSASSLHRNEPIKDSTIKELAGVSWIGNEEKKRIMFNIKGTHLKPSIYYINRLFRMKHLTQSLKHGNQIILMKLIMQFKVL